MLASLIGEFLEIPEVEVLTVLREDLVPLFPADHPRLQIRCSGSPRAFADCLSGCEAVVLIAPETGRRLEELTSLAERERKPVLGSTSLGVRKAADKAAAAGLLSRRGIPVPGGRSFPLRAVREVAGSLCYPVVVKPLDGAGTTATFLVRDGARLREAVEQIEAASAVSAFLVQDYVPGEAVSVSLLVLPGTGRCLALSLNRQLVYLDERGVFRYRGVSVPYAHPQAQKALSLAARVPAALPGLAGYVGVDMVLGPAGPVVLEVNPRITDSWVALARVSKTNLAAALLDACLRLRLPEDWAVEGQAEFRLAENPNGR
ncbi:MAG: ATP-grasp domain-containing protein [Clostridia bacterium]|jgi:predicted ATP-grasp superfamily ATP-dependent carboligase|nr:ATP-grasp domain-containing protein [Clostridia bacterium]MDH7572303.1 ATP-grasp domain-containing protein [Clostridia bacterium]